MPHWRWMQQLIILPVFSVFWQFHHCFLLLAMSTCHFPHLTIVFHLLAISPLSNVFFSSIPFMIVFVISPLFFSFGYTLSLSIFIFWRFHLYNLLATHFHCRFLSSGLLTFIISRLFQEARKIAPKPDAADAAEEEEEIVSHCDPTLQRTGR